jgi:hypothetical protein
VRSLSWNPEHGWLACGGDDGLLKVRACRACVRAARACGSLPARAAAARVRHTSCVSTQGTRLLDWKCCALRHVAWT